MLQYKTRDGSSPNGKPWVFFFAAPEEVTRTLPRIAEDLFNFCNCAIWYDTPEDPATVEELERALEQCALAVLPVVPSSLDPGGRVQRVLRPLLRRHPMPLLPILEDPNLLDAFNALFENKQLLRRHVTDQTAMPYTDRLKRFLDTNLLRDELTESVKQAFRGCIFLSYRTDDRSMILKLLQQIHQDPQCRRIGIWYDQFLIPGEDFNDGIAQAILDSDLFLLALTHNMVGGESYVTRHEYPLARQAEKDILPVRLEAVDPEQTSLRFPEIPEPADVDAAIRALGERLTDRDGDSSPEEDFLLGLAYLYGLNMERNVSLALELLTESANRGHAPAALRLATIEQKEQTEEEAREWKLRWLRHYAALARRDYEAAPGPETAGTYGDALDRLSEALFTPETKEDSFLYSARAATLLERHKLFENCAQVCSNYGLRLTGAGLPQDGLRMLKRALNFHITLSKQDSGYTVTHLPQLAYCYYNIGCTARHTNDLGLAKVAFESTVSYFRPLAQISPEDYSLPLAESYGNLGSVHAMLWDQTHRPEDYDMAERCQGTAVRILNPLIDGNPAVYEPAFARCCSAAGALFSRGGSGERDRALLMLNQAIPILGYYNEQYPGTCAESLALSLANRAAVYFQAGDIQAARADYEAALPILQELPWQTMTLAKTYWNMGNTFAVEKDPTTALTWYAQAKALYESGSVQGADTCPDYAACCYNYGNLLYETGAYAEALAMVHKTIELYQTLQGGNPEIFAERILDRRRLAAYLEKLI